MPLQQRKQNPIQGLTPLVQWTKLDLPSRRDNLKRRADRGYVPARISLWILITRGEINSPIPVQFVQQVLQAAVIRDYGRQPSYCNTPGRDVTQFGHSAGKETVSFQDSTTAACGWVLRVVQSPVNTMQNQLVSGGWESATSSTCKASHRAGVARF